MFEKNRFLLSGGQLSLLLSATLFVGGCNAQSNTQGTKAERSTPPTTSPQPTRQIEFSSVYTQLDDTTCSAVKNVIDKDEAPLICHGYGDYMIFVEEHGVFPRFYIGREISEKLDDWSASDFPSFAQNSTGWNMVIEWRLADGEPFACIVRSKIDRSLINPDEKGLTDKFVVKNLKGFGPIEITIDASDTKNANIAARNAADSGFRKL